MSDVDDEELAALRAEALASLKSSKLSNNLDDSSGSKNVAPISTVVASSSYSSYNASDQSNYSVQYGRRNHQAQNNRRGRGGRIFPKVNQRSNLIVITPTTTEGKNSDEKSSSQLVLPQHKWCQSINEDSSSPRSFKRTGPTRFNRHDSDSDSNDSEPDLSDNDSYSNETILQDEPSDHYTTRSARSISRESTPEKCVSERRLSFQKLDCSHETFSNRESTSVYNCLKNTHLNSNEGLEVRSPSVENDSEPSWKHGSNRNPSYKQPDTLSDTKQSSHETNLSNPQTMNGGPSHKRKLSSALSSGTESSHPRTEALSEHSPSPKSNRSAGLSKHDLRFELKKRMQEMQQNIKKRSEHGERSRSYSHSPPSRGHSRRRAARSRSRSANGRHSESPGRNRSRRQSHSSDHHHRHNSAQRRQKGHSPNDSSKAEHSPHRNHKRNHSSSSDHNGKDKSRSPRLNHKQGRSPSPDHGGKDKSLSPRRNLKRDGSPRSDHSRKERSRSPRRNIKRGRSPSSDRSRKERSRSPRRNMKRDRSPSSDRSRKERSRSPRRNMKRDRSPSSDRSGKERSRSPRNIKRDRSPSSDRSRKERSCSPRRNIKRERSPSSDRSIKERSHSPRRNIKRDKSPSSDPVRKDKASIPKRDRSPSLEHRKERSRSPHSNHKQKASPVSDSSKKSKRLSPVRKHHRHESSSPDRRKRDQSRSPFKSYSRGQSSSSDHRKREDRSPGSSNHLRKARSPSPDYYRHDSARGRDGRHRNCSSSSSASSSSHSSSAVRLRSVSSVVKAVSVVNKVDAKEKMVSSESDSHYYSEKNKLDRVKPVLLSVKSSIETKSCASDGQKRVPVHMRLGSLPGKRVIQMTKDVEAAFVNTSSDEGGDEANVRNKKDKLHVKYKSSDRKSDETSKRLVQRNEVHSDTFKEGRFKHRR